MTRRSRSKPQPKDAGALLRIGGMDTQIVQMQDYLDLLDPNQRRVLVLNFASARLSDINDQEIFSGQIIVRLLTDVPPATLAIVSRLLTPFKGYFVINVRGTYTTPGSYAEVLGDLVYAANIQPTPVKSKAKLHLVSVA